MDTVMVNTEVSGINGVDKQQLRLLVAILVLYLQQLVQKLGQLLAVGSGIKTQH
jgi:hypothetical protein